MIEWYGRQMTLFANTNGYITSYVYNSDGIRTQKVHYDENAEYVGTTKYTLDGNKIVAENNKKALAVKDGVAINPGEIMFPP